MGIRVLPEFRPYIQAVVLQSKVLIDKQAYIFFYIIVLFGFYPRDYSAPIF